LALVSLRAPRATGLRPGVIDFPFSLRLRNSRRSGDARSARRTESAGPPGAPWVAKLRSTWARL